MPFIFPYPACVLIRKISRHMRSFLLLIFSMFVMSQLALLAAGTTITMKGSDTMVRLGQRIAEEYMKRTPGVAVQVIGGGSGTGFAALLNNTTDIAQASRDIKSKEITTAEASGIHPFRIRVALDGIAVFVHESSPVKELSMDQLKGIYTGTITNWSEVGGPDKKIIVYTRENNSGTYRYFKEHVLEEADFSDYAQPLPGTSAVVHAISQDPLGIGYGGIAWSVGVRQVLVRPNDSTPGIAPTMEQITSGAYPISRYLYWFSNGEPQGAIRDFVNFVLSDEGQQVVIDAEYVPLPPGEGAAQRLGSPTTP